MKKLSFILVVMIATSLNGATWTVDSNTARPADFRTLQAANDSEEVASGDILHVMPSTAGYGNLALSKGLVIIGPGYLLNVNLDFNVAAPSARIGALTIMPGADGSLITGLEIAGNVTFSAIEGAFANNVTVKRNFIQGTVVTGTGANCGDIRILQNHVTGGLSFSSTANSGLLIRGNYFGTWITVAHSADSGIFAHNVVNSVSGSTVGGGMLAENNLVRSNLSKSGTAVFRNNWSFNLNPGNFVWNTEEEITFYEQFVGGDPVDASWQLKADAAVRGSGRDGVDPGMFAGPDPYVLSGLPSVPMVIGVRAPSSASASGLPITVDIQVNP